MSSAKPNCPVRLCSELMARQINKSTARYFWLLLISIVLLTLLASPLTAQPVPAEYAPSRECNQGTRSNGYVSGNYIYRATDEPYSPGYQDIDALRRIYGPGTELADWVDLRQSLTSDSEVSRFVRDVGIPLQATNGFCGNILVTYDGQTHTQDRRNLLAYHRGVRPRDWAILDTIGTDQLHLGRWNHFGRILIRARVGAPSPPAREESAGLGPDLQRLGTSFDCARDTAPMIAMVCSNEELRRADIEQLQRYYAFRHAAPDQQQDARARFIAAIRQVRAECDSQAQQRMAVCVSRHLVALREAWMVSIRATRNQAAMEEAGLSTDQLLSLQSALRNRGYLPPSSTIDGVFGTGTRNAITRFQTDRGIQATGFATQETIAAIQGGSAPMAASLSDSPALADASWFVGTPAGTCEAVPPPAQRVQALRAAGDRGARAIPYRPPGAADDSEPTRFTIQSTNGAAVVYYRTLPDCVVDRGQMAGAPASPSAPPAVPRQPPQTAAVPPPPVGPPPFMSPCIAMPRATGGANVGRGAMPPDPEIARQECLRDNQARQEQYNQQVAARQRWEAQERARREEIERPAREAREAQERAARQQQQAQLQARNQAVASICGTRPVAGISDIVEGNPFTIEGRCFQKNVLEVAQVARWLSANRALVEMESLTSRGKFFVLDSDSAIDPATLGFGLDGIFNPSAGQQYVLVGMRPVTFDMRGGGTQEVPRVRVQRLP